MALKSAWFSSDMQIQMAAENKPPLRVGSKGDGVKKLQLALVKLGHKLPISVKADGTADGDFGNETSTAVREFQKKNGLSADGVAGHDTLYRMDDQLADSFPALGMTAAQIATLKSDIAIAKLIANRCTSQLVMSTTFPRPPIIRPGSPLPVEPALTPGGLQAKILSVLSDTFDIDGTDQQDVFEIRKRFMGFIGRIDLVEFELTDRHAPSDQSIGHDAFVEYKFGVPLSGNKIFLTKSYFEKGSQPERALILIHEYIHMFNNGAGHPGADGNPNSGQLTLFQQTHIGIPFEFAIYNAYCFEYFAKWTA